MTRDKECRELTTLANSTHLKLEKEGKSPKRWLQQLLIASLKCRYG
nr:MAG TPA: hypothetical protein [Caudoviricetes sp.]